MLLSQADPISQANTLTWQSFTLPAAGHTLHNSYGTHTFIQDLCYTEFIDLHLDQALAMVGSGGYVTQLFYRITADTTGPDWCAEYFVNAAYDRNLVPILRLQGKFGADGIWIKPDPGPDGSYADIAAAFARYVAGLPRRNTHPLYVSIWNEPDLWIEWSNAPNAQEYARFFVAVSNAIRGLGDSGIRIMNGPVTPNNMGFIQQMVQVPGFVNAFDVWGSHCYPYNHPPSYNIHDGTARYLNATIDCYIVDAGIIQKYGGRTGFKVIVKETGYGLGDNVYGFEGYPAINEALRAQYAPDAFDKYWRKWPELLTATPYELGDPWSSWEHLDWIDYDLSLDPFHFSYEPYAQYNQVVALTKPHGDVVPRSIDISFRAQVDPALPVGSYASDVEGAAGGMTVNVTQTAAVHVTDTLIETHFPTIAAGARDYGWVMDSPTPMEPLAEMSNNLLSLAQGTAAIVPSHLLQPSTRVSAADLQGAAARLSLETTAAAVARPMGSEAPAAAFAALATQALSVIDLTTMQEVRRLPLDSQPTSLVPGPDAGHIYAHTDEGEIVLIDTENGRVIAAAEAGERPQRMVFDPVTETLLVADAGDSTLKRFEADLSSLPESTSVEDIPGQILLDVERRRLFVLLPGINTILSLDADTLETKARYQTVGGPIVSAAYDSAAERLYVLSALAPRYRGLTVLQGEALSFVALVAGSQALPLQHAQAVAVLGNGRVLLAEGRQMYILSTEDFTVVRVLPGDSPLAPAAFAPAAAPGAVWLSGNELYRYP
jgi:DNA-binding beta-propeller fold protein YncE